MKKLVVPALFILLGVLLRLLPHPANVAPIAAMALFGGVYLNKKYAFIMPLGALFLSDLCIGFYESMPYVYISFVITGLVGMWIREHKSIKTVIFGSLLSSVLFFLITNFGFWLAYSLYPKTFTGQLTAYITALPFFRNTLLGDLFYTGFFFGTYELVGSFFKYKQKTKIFA